VHKVQANVPLPRIIFFKQTFGLGFQGSLPSCSYSGGNIMTNSMWIRDSSQFSEQLSKTHISRRRDSVYLSIVNDILKKMDKSFMIQFTNNIAKTKKASEKAPA